MPHPEVWRLRLRYRWFALNTTSIKSVEQIAVLVRDADGWKIDFTGSESEQLLEMVPKVFGDTAKAFNQVRAGILDGTLKTRDEARQELKRLKAKYGL